MWYNFYMKKLVSSGHSYTRRPNQINVHNQRQVQMLTTFFKKKKKKISQYKNLINSFFGKKLLTHQTKAEKNLVGSSGFIQIVDFLSNGIQILATWCRA